jgi:hypothetical protein
MNLGQALGDSVNTTQLLFDLFFGQRYTSPGNGGSEYTGIPMAYRETPEIKRFIKANKFRVRYRGPRRKFLRADGKYRVSTLGRQDCLKADALHFSLYKA